MKFTPKRLSSILIITGVLVFTLPFLPFLKDELMYLLKNAKGQTYTLKDGGSKDTVFSRLLTTKPITIEPINRDFSLVIEKIGVNVPVVADVDVTREDAYKNALKNGVAHASYSPYPSQNPGNVYFFAHASVNFWELGKYATVFNLLRKLNYGDRIHVFYLNDIYVYEVVNKEVVKGFNTASLTRSVIEPILTLQTCDPPGTTFSRLIVTAKLIEFQDK